MNVPPLHPLINHFTLALPLFALACDVLGTWLKRDSLRGAGCWALCGAALITPFTALTGWMWLHSMPEMHHDVMKTHQWLGISLAATLIPLASWRMWLHMRGRKLGLAYFLIAALVVAEIVVQGYLGGSMTYGHENGGSQEAPGAATTAPNHDHR